MQKTNFPFSFISLLLTTPAFYTNPGRSQASIVAQLGTHPGTQLDSCLPARFMPVQSHLLLPALRVAPRGLCRACVGTQSPVMLHGRTSQDHPHSGWLDLALVGPVTCSTSRCCFHFVEAQRNDYLTTPKGVFRFFRTVTIHPLIVLFLLSYSRRYSLSFKGICLRWLSFRANPSTSSGVSPCVGNPWADSLFLASHWGFLDRRCAAPAE